MFLDLSRHKAYADTALLRAIRDVPQAREDAELCAAFHHILLANRFWLLLILGRDFDFEAESNAPKDFSSIAERYRATQAEESAWLERLDDRDLSRLIQTPHLPDYKLTVAHGWMQVCLHSQGHRAQCAKRLRSLGGNPPMLDFVLWLKDRPAPAWW